jgi:hypothetical protein
MSSVGCSPRLTFTGLVLGEDRSTFTRLTLRSTSPPGVVMVVVVEEVRDARLTRAAEEALERARTAASGVDMLALLAAARRAEGLMGRGDPSMDDFFEKTGVAALEVNTPEDLSPPLQADTLRRVAGLPAEATIGAAMGLLLALFTRRVETLVCGALPKAALPGEEWRVVLEEAFSSVVSTDWRSLMREGLRYLVGAAEGLGTVAHTYIKRSVNTIN